MSKLCVVFDLDDTLYPERAFALSGFRAAGLFAAQKWQIDGPGRAHDPAIGRRPSRHRVPPVRWLNDCPHTPMINWPNWLSNIAAMIPKSNSTKMVHGRYRTMARSHQLV